jgi:hypothetical protein
MAEHCRFFNSAEDDLREYTAAEFAEYFSRFLSDGLYTINGRAGLKVTPGAGLSINIDTGYAFIRVFSTMTIITAYLSHFFRPPSIPVKSLLTSPGWVIPPAPHFPRCLTLR